MGTKAFDEDDTDPGPCCCAACRERLRLREQVTAAAVTRFISIEAPLAKDSPAWTVYLERAPDKDGFRGHGDTEEEAIEDALRVLRGGT